MKGKCKCGNCDKNVTKKEWEKYDGFCKRCWDKLGKLPYKLLKMHG